MKHRAYATIALLVGLASLNTLSAADSIEHFVTKDGRHFCSVFMRNDFQSCEKFGISYEGEKVVAGEKPYFAAGYPNIAEIIIGKEKFCVEGSPTDTGREVERENCETASGSVLIEKDSISLETIDDDSPVDSIEVPSDVTVLTDSGTSAESDTDTIPLTETGDTSGTGAEIQSATQSRETSFLEGSHSSIICNMIGGVVNCDEGANTLVTMGFGLLASIFLFSFIFGIFWLWMLVHALSSSIPNKILWVLFIFFLSPIGAIVYYFVIKKGFVAPETLTQTPTYPDINSVPTPVASDQNQNGT